MNSKRADMGDKKKKKILGKLAIKSFSPIMCARGVKTGQLHPLGTIGTLPDR